MKNYFLLLFISFFSVYHTLVAQEVVIDTAYRPKTYQQQLQQFASYDNSSTDIIFLGNSLTARAHWNELLELSTARNRGISGDTTFGILERIGEITEGKPAKVFLLIGINDISRSFPDDQILVNYRKIISRIQSESPNTTIYIQTILPVNHTFNVYKRHYHKDEHILHINDELRKLAKEIKVNLIDLHPHFLDENNRLEANYTEEGLHLNAAGYLKWKELLLPYLE